MSGHIDAHGHLGEYGQFRVPRGTAGDLIHRMDLMGVERLAISAHAAFASDYRWGNGLAAEAAAQHPGRIFFYAVANPGYPLEIEAELERCAGRPGFVGVKLHPAVHACALEAPAYAAAWRWAGRRRAPVLTHFWKGDTHCGADNVRRVAGAHPEVQLVLAHLGGFDRGYQELPSLAAEFPNLWFDTSGSRHPRGIIEDLTAAGLAGRLLYGSDMPFIDPGSQLGKVLYADVPEEAKRAILRGNALRLFGWED